MDRIELQKLRDLPIEGVAERLGLRVRMHKCLCPFHEDHHPSMSFSIRKNTYRCFVCGAHGDTIDLVMKHLRKDFRGAAEWLADGSWLTVNGSGFDKPQTSEPKPFDASRYEKYFSRPWLNDEAQKFLFEERKLDPRVVRWCRLTSCRDKKGVPWLQIPYYDMEGKLTCLIGFAASLVEEPLTMNHEPRFRFPQGSQCGIYNLPVLNMLKPGDALYITEGCSDCWAMLSSGHKAIAIPSATLLTKKDIELLETWNLKHETTFHMWPDNDAPGERLFLQLQKVLPSLVHHQLPPGCKDFGEYYLRR